MKIGLAQINTTVGDLRGNAELILDAYRRLRDEGAELVVFPELAVCGYPPKDLLFKSRFVSDTQAMLAEIAHQIGSVPALIGTVEPNAGRGRPFHNAAAWVHGGEVRAVGHKRLLPTYDVFDEDRYFESGEESLVVTHGGKRIGVTICEDLWTAPKVSTARRYRVDPLEALAHAELDLLVNLSASPWHIGKDRLRRDEIVTAAARRCGCPVVYANLVGGNDELIFDGNSLVADAEGNARAHLAAFAPEVRTVDLGAPAVPRESRPVEADMHDALVLGLRDYMHKTGFTRGIIGLSGGIDSAVTAGIAVAALGKENVIGVSLPSGISSQHSRDDAAKLAENLGIQYEVLPIGDLVGAAEKALGPYFANTAPDVTEENIQARSRGLLLMALSNKFKALVLSTGNKSELAVGYCTLYGDMAGGLAVISDVPKMKVYALAEWMNREREIVPRNTIDKPPSAELRPDQKDEDSLPPYPVLDEILRLYVEEGKSRQEIVEAGFDLETVNDIARKVDLNEYKRKQAAPGLKVTPLAFGVGRRIPIVQRYVSI